MLAPRKQNRLVAGFLWALRALVVIVGGYALYNGWFNLDVEKLANVVTVLTAVMAVWALFDRTFLDWIIRKVRRAWERVRPRPRPEGEATASPITAPQDDDTSSEPITGIPRDDVRDETTEGIVDPTVGCGFGILVAVVAAILLFGALTFGPQLWDKLFPPAPIGGEGGPPPGPPPPPLPPAPIEYLVKEGDSCWAIAKACIGNPGRLDELGPPLNPIDVQHPLCPIRAGSTINLPPDWTGCPHT